MKNITYNSFRHYTDDNHLIITDSSTFINERKILENINLNTIQKTIIYTTTIKQRDHHQIIVILWLLLTTLLLGVTFKSIEIMTSFETLNRNDWLGALFTILMFLPIALILVIFATEFILDFGKVSHILYQKLAKGKTQFVIEITINERTITLLFEDQKLHNKLSTYLRKYKFT